MTLCTAVTAGSSGLGLLRPITTPEGLVEPVQGRQVAVHEASLWQVLLTQDRPGKGSLDMQCSQNNDSEGRAAPSKVCVRAAIPQWLAARPLQGFCRTHAWVVVATVLLAVALCLDLASEGDTTRGTSPKGCLTLLGRACKHHPFSPLPRFFH